jgi:aspartate kinase
MKIIIQKFGGTSLQDDASRLMVIDKIKNALEAGYNPVIVVSALGRKGDPYATDTLLETVQKYNIDIAEREKDMLLACGEIISCVIISQILISQGLESVALNGTEAGIITDNNFGNACVKRVYPHKIMKILQEGKIPVIAGFQGITEDLQVTTLGRGGSDTTAAIIGTALKAEKIEIYSDVNGLLTADPKTMNNAKLIGKASYSEVVELAYKGAKLIHPSAVEIAEDAKIPLSLRNTFNNLQGTEVAEFKSNRLVTGITENCDIIQFILLNNKNNSQTLQDLANFGVSLDMIDVSPRQLSFLVSSKNKKIVEDYLSHKDIEYGMNKKLCKISVVGSGMSGIPGVMAKISSALHSNNIEIYKSMDSHTAISCLIEQGNEKKAVKVLHEKFKLESL